MRTYRGGNGRARLAAVTLAGAALIAATIAEAAPPPQSNAGGMPQCQADLAAANTANAALAAELATCNANNGDLSSQLGTCNAENAALEADLATCNATNAGLAAENAALSAQNQSLTQQNQQLTAQNEALSGQLQACNDANGQLGSQLTTCQTDLAECQNGCAEPTPEPSPEPTPEPEACNAQPSYFQPELFDESASRACEGPGLCANPADPDVLYGAAGLAQNLEILIQIELYKGLGAFSGTSITPGSYPMTTPAESNYRTCGVCPRMFANCEDVDGQLVCARQFYPTGGAVFITQTFPDLVFDLSNVTFTEVTIDEQDFTSTPVPGGCQSEVVSASFSAPVNEFAEPDPEPTPEP